MSTTATDTILSPSPSSPLLSLPLESSTRVRSASAPMPILDTDSLHDRPASTMSTTSATMSDIASSLLNELSESVISLPPSSLQYAHYHYERLYKRIKVLSERMLFGTDLLTATTLIASCVQEAEQVLGAMKTRQTQIKMQLQHLQQQQSMTSTTPTSNTTTTTTTTTPMGINPIDAAIIAASAIKKKRNLNIPTDSTIKNTTLSSSSSSSLSSPLTSTSTSTSASAPSSLIRSLPEPPLSLAREPSASMSAAVLASPGLHSSNSSSYSSSHNGTSSSTSNINSGLLDMDLDSDGISSTLSHQLHPSQHNRGDIPLPSPPPAIIPTDVNNLSLSTELITTTPTAAAVPAAGSSSSAAASGAAGISSSLSSPSSYPHTHPVVMSCSNYPLLIFRVNVQHQYTITRKEAKRLKFEDRDALISIPARVMGTPDRQHLFFVAKDICQSIHLRKGSVAKAVQDFTDQERVRMPVFCQRSSGSGCTQVLTVLTEAGVERLMRDSRQPTALQVWDSLKQKITAVKSNVGLTQNTSMINRVETIGDTTESILFPHSGSASSSAFNIMDSGHSSITSPITITTSTSISPPSTTTAAPVSSSTTAAAVPTSSIEQHSHSVVQKAPITKQEAITSPIVTIGAPTSTPLNMGPIINTSSSSSIPPTSISSISTSIPWTSTSTTQSPASASTRTFPLTSSTQTAFAVPASPQRSHSHSQPSINITSSNHSGNNNAPVIPSISSPPLQFIQPNNPIPSPTIIPLPQKSQNTPIPILTQTPPEQQQAEQQQRQQQQHASMPFLLNLLSQPSLSSPHTVGSSPMGMNMNTNPLSSRYPYNHPHPSAAISPGPQQLFPALTAGGISNLSAGPASSPYLYPSLYSNPTTNTATPSPMNTAMTMNAQHQHHLAEQLLARHMMTNSVGNAPGSNNNPSLFMNIFQQGQQQQQQRHQQQPIYNPQQHSLAHVNINIPSPYQSSLFPYTQFTTNASLSSILPASNTLSSSTPLFSIPQPPSHHSTHTHPHPHPHPHTHPHTIVHPSHTQQQSSRPAYQQLHNNIPP